MLDGADGDGCLGFVAEEPDEGSGLELEGAGSEFCASAPTDNTPRKPSEMINPIMKRTRIKDNSPPA